MVSFPPSDPELQPMGKQRARPVPITDYSSDKVETTIQNSVPSLLLFNDSYHQGWRATVNGKEVGITPANYYAMAITVPPGLTHIVFRFLPDYFVTAAKLSGAGLILLCIVTAVARVYYWRKRQLQISKP